MRDTGGRHHIGSTRSDRGGGDHDLPPQLCLGIADRGKRHGLFILAAPRWKNVLNLFQRLRKASHVTMAENAKNTGKKRHAMSVDFSVLVDQVTHQRLSYCQLDRISGHAVSPSRISQCYAMTID